MPDVEESKRFKRDLPVPISDAVKLAKSEKAAKLRDEEKRLRQKLKEHNAGKRTEIEEKASARDALLADIESGMEIGSVECFTRYDYKRKKVEVVRTDTDEVVETRVMSADEATDGVDGASDSGDEGDDADAEEKPAKKARGRKKKD